MITRGLFLFGMVASSLVLSGCGASTSLSQAALAQANRPMADASQNLSASADRVAGAVETLARVQAARTPPVAAPVSATMAGVPEALRRPIIENWSGPGVELANKLATIAGYRFVIEGNAPAVEPMVNVSWSETPVIEALSDLGVQVGPFAQVVASAPAKTIYYRYLPPPTNATGGSSRPGMTK